MRGPNRMKPEWIREFYSNGNLEWDIPLNANGKRHGLAKQYHSNGQLKLTRNHVDGKAQGIETIYYKSGEVAQISTFVDGEPHGEFIRYNEDGTIAERAQYDNGKLVK